LASIQRDDRSLVRDLSEEEFAGDAERLVADGDLAVVFDPAKTSEDVVNARRRLVPRVLLVVPPSTQQRHSYEHVHLSPSQLNADMHYP